MSTTLAEVIDVIERIKAARQTIIVHPDDEATLREALAKLDPLLTVGLTIRINEYVPAGTMFATRTNCIESYEETT